MNQVIEATYPSTFRSNDVQILGNHIGHHNSVSLIGMKRVGISNFLRFFLNHPQVQQQFIQADKQLLIIIDMNNLVEKTLYAFWMLTLKKIVDAIDEQNVSLGLKGQSSAIFTQSIQLGDFFFTVEAVHKLIKLLVEEGRYITLFFLRFDRLQHIITAELFANLQGLKDTGNHLTYVFTSYRPLYEMVPSVFTHSALAGFLHEMYMQPARTQDMRIILSTFQKRYDLHLEEAMSKKILELAAGHVQYLLLSLIKLKNEPSLVDFNDLEKCLSGDEEIHFLSEELWTSLTATEQQSLSLFGKSDLLRSKYLWETGVLIHETNPKLFCPLFANYLRHILKKPKKNEFDFTKKEYFLFRILKDHENELVERETIIHAVWPDEIELGISDWSIDRLISRVRAKLASQESEYKIVTVITRGYKLVSGA